MEEIIRVSDQFYILATSSRVDDRTLVLKDGGTFAVFDRFGDFQPVGLGKQGLYHEGTRFLSRLELYMGEHRPLLLTSTVMEHTPVLSVDLTNPDFYENERVALARNTLHLSRSSFLYQATCFTRITIQNFALHSVDISFRIFFAADFADIFEVRGVKRERRGRLLEPDVKDNAVLLAYEGLDGVVRRTRLECSPSPAEISAGAIRFEAHLESKGTAVACLTISCDPGDRVALERTYHRAFAETQAKLEKTRAGACHVTTSRGRFNSWLTRSMADLRMMITLTPKGPYPYAGVPWFSAPFGRDGVITALETLWINPDIARGVLAYLAATQARAIAPAQDAEPGKILHEARQGEMAALGEVPFGQYYGSVDATPLFVMLAGAFYERTADRPFLEALWPHVERAIHWIDTLGDRDGDGFVEYYRRSPHGLVHQGWKDSVDAIFHANGVLADGPIALCEVQAYVYAAKRQAAVLAAALGRVERAGELQRQAEALQRRFEEVFWDDELSTYVLALDGEKRPCRVRTSNAGHCLFAGIASQEHASRVAQTLMGEDFFSGWGIRTVAGSEVRYNPISYHNGSVWPHDNALIAAGMARYGMKDRALKILASLYDASLFVDLARLPELFCGFARRAGEGPTPYSVACAPQSWSAATVFLLLQACLGLSIDADNAQVRFSHPRLPEFLKEVKIQNLHVGKSSLDLLIEGRDQDVGVDVLRLDGDVDVSASR